MYVDGDLAYLTAYQLLMGYLMPTFDSFFIILFTNPSARAGYDTRSIFKRSLTGLNSEFFLLLD